jgi:nanoRNase/pAp phosphatase (c-di-AMP/oligoRNAs hydrolase)
VAGIDDYGSHSPCIQWQSIVTPNSRAASSIAGFALSVYVDHESIRMCENQESVAIVVLDIDHHPSRTQGILP